MSATDQPNPAADRAARGGTDGSSDGQGHLSRSEFQRLADFIEDYSGIKTPPTKTTMIEGRLRRRVRAVGLQTLSQYCAYLFEQNGLAAESVHLIDAVTTNKTDFFREPEHFRMLVEQVLPSFMSGPRHAERSPLKVWSAGCSTGAEPYTLAMVLADFAQTSAMPPSSILATDLCTEALDTAVEGIYPEEMAAPIPPQLRSRYVMRAKDRDWSAVRIVPELRARVRFGRLNLMNGPYPVDRDMDVIFCRNTLIYFNKPTQQAVLNRLCEHLRPDGYLFLGHSEALSQVSLPVDPAGPSMFRRR